MTYTDLMDKVFGNRFAEQSLGRMMDEVEKETGRMPEWDDEVPDWILKQFGMGGKK